MGFSGKTALCVYVLYVASTAWAADGGERLEISVMVLNRVKLSQEEIKETEVEAARIFRSAGIHVRWIDCSKGDACHHVPANGEFVLSIVPDGKTSSDLVYGLAFLGPAGEGKYSDVFFRRVQAAAANSGENVARFLGTVAAHELGHLLLGSNAHTYDGVMSAVWKQQTLRRMDMGSLLFTREQATAMRSRVAGDAGFRELPAYTRARPLVP